MNQDLSVKNISQSGNKSALATDRTGSRTAISSRVLIGATLGLSWGAALRAWMSILALAFGERPQFTWLGTFGAILLPAALMGGGLGWAAWAAETSAEPQVEVSARKRWRWVILSPLLLAVGPLVFLPGFISALLTSGLGGGAIAVALIGLFGGYALSGLGAIWLRRVSGLLALLLTLAAGIGFFLGDSYNAAAQDAGRAFGALFFILLMALLAAGVSAPFRYQDR